MTKATTLVIFGATGDLVSKKIIPSIYNLYQSGNLPNKFKVIAFARRDFDGGKYNEVIEESLNKYGGIDSSTDLKDFFNLFTYNQGDFNNLEAYKTLKEKMVQLDNDFNECSEKIFYLAVPPEYFNDLFNNLAQSQVTVGCVEPDRLAKILVEKPFGKDLKTAEELDETLSRLFEEKQIYRIDHYLAKWVIDNILSFRSTNALFEPIWNNQHIESIEITTLESLGVENRGGFYDPIGALRDVGQNHLLEILALLTMELPENESEESLRKNRGELLEKLKTMTEEEVIANSRRAQYKGYKDIQDVRLNSDTETYFKVKLFLESPRWSNVPITIQAGKKFAHPKKEIVVNFKKVNGYNQNKIIFSIEPEEKIEINFNTRISEKSEITSRRTVIKLNDSESRRQYVEEYTQLLLDAINGDQRNFVTSQEVKAMWKFIDPIIETWQKGLVPLESYEPGAESID